MSVAKIANQWAFDPEQLIMLVDLLIMPSVDEAETNFQRLLIRRMLKILYSPEHQQHRWVKLMQKQSGMTAAEVRVFREQTEQRIVGNIMQAYYLACAERDGRPTVACPGVLPGGRLRRAQVRPQEISQK